HARVKSQLIECANIVNTCDRLWKMTRNLGNDILDEETRDERDDLEMMFPDEDIDSDDFEVGDYQN
ncbi:MAG: hypothetical protein K2M10_09015, partial [Muribaculaceae bacterium]|nr:hypothetical protein [Muribaculaceae bacterium]